MSKYTKEEIINDRRSGLKHFDYCVQQVGKQQVFDDALAIYRQYPNMTGSQLWLNVSWAFGNACINIVNQDPKRQNSHVSVKLGFNLDEALTDEEMQYFAKELNLKLEDYVAPVKRKVVKNKPTV